MELALSEEHRSLGQTVRAFLDDHSSESTVRRLMATPSGHDPATWELMATQLGLQSMLVSEGFEGMGFGVWEACVILEEMGRVNACGPYLASGVIATHALSQAEDRDLLQEMLPRLAAGTHIATVALEEDGAAWGLQDLTTTITGEHDVVVDGRKILVVDATVADHFVVVGHAPDGPAAAVVASDAPGVVVEALSTLDQTRKLANVTFDGAPGRCLVRGEAAGRHLARLLDVAAVALAAEQLGGAQQCLDMSVEYATSRIQFGRAIGSFQAIKHKCADMLVAVESARSAVRYAARCIDDGHPEASVASSVAASYTSDTYLAAASDLIQIHGGIGFTWEHSAHLFFKRAKSSSRMFGSPEEHRSRIGEHLGI